MKKKLIAVFLIVATLLTCAFAFAACDKDKGKGNGAGETYTEEEIASLMGKLATYVIANSDKYEMYFESKVETRADEDTPFFKNCEWVVSSCILVFKFNTAENATSSIDNIKKAYAPLFEEDGEFIVEQHGAILLVGGKNRIDEVRATEDKTVEILSQEFIDQYKANLKELLNSDAFGYQSFYYEKEDKTYFSSMCPDLDNEGKEKTIIKLDNNATTEEIKAFNDDCSTTEHYGKGTKINDKLWFFVDEKAG